MIQEIADDFISTNNVLITAAAGSGSTVLSLCLINHLLRDDKVILYYNPSGDIDSSFVKRYYPRVYRDVAFLSMKLKMFLSYLEKIEYKVDHLVLDPGDSLMVNKMIIPNIISLLHGKILATSQIRNNLSEGGKVYSSLENLNKSYNCELFKYSIWIRDVSEPSNVLKSRYLDIFKENRKGNQSERRYILKFHTITGALIE